MTVKKTVAFEAAMERLDEIVAALDSGKCSLDQSLKLFSEGAELLSFCNKRLADARLRVEELFPGGAKGAEDAEL